MRMSAKSAIKRQTFGEILRCTQGDRQYLYMSNQQGDVKAVFLFLRMLLASVLCACECIAASERASVVYRVGDHGAASASSSGRHHALSRG